MTNQIPDDISSIFLAVVEKVCETLLLEQNLVIHGPGIVKTLQCSFSKNRSVEPLEEVYCS
jgi:hypothetical protein